MAAVNCVNLFSEFGHRPCNVYKISTRNASKRPRGVMAVQKRRKKFKSFKFIDEFIPECRQYLPAQHLQRLLGWTEVEDPIPPQFPEAIAIPPKMIEPDVFPETGVYQQTFPEFSILAPSKPRFVELHVHLEGTLFRDTLWQLYQKKKHKHEWTDHMPFDNVDELLSFLQRSSAPGSLGNDSNALYDKHRYLCEILRGDYEAIERVAYELCRRQFDNKVFYTEVRFNPFLLCASFDTSRNSAVAWNEFDEIVTPNDSLSAVLDVEVRRVMQCVIGGLNRGCREYQIQVNPIVSCLRYRPDLSAKLVDLSWEFRDQANNRCHVVGMDLFGGHELQYHSRLFFDAFRKCKQRGINRTVHCGDSFSMTGAGLLNTIHGLNPERIAYCVAAKMPKHILHRIFGRQLHLELTPKSNLLQFPHLYGDGEYDMKDFMQWLVRNSANFSLSTDFPILMDCDGHLTYLNEVHRCRMEYGMSDWEIAQMQLNAARASFLNDNDKNILLHILRERWQRIAPNVEPANFFKNFRDKSWNNQDLLRLDLLKS